MALTAPVGHRLRPCWIACSRLSRPAPRELVRGSASSSAEVTWLGVAVGLMPTSRAAPPETNGVLNDVPHALPKVEKG